MTARSRKQQFAAWAKAARRKYRAYQPAHSRRLFNRRGVVALHTGVRRIAARAA